MQSSNYYAFVALDLARQRAEEARSARLAALAEPGEPRIAGLRRTVARIALAVARAADDQVGQVPLASH